MATSFATRRRHAAERREAEILAWSKKVNGDPLVTLAKGMFRGLASVVVRRAYDDAHCEVQYGDSFYSPFEAVEKVMDHVAWVWTDCDVTDWQSVGALHMLLADAYSDEFWSELAELKETEVQ